MYKAVEGAEDSRELAVEDLKRAGVTADDCVIGIAASGRTPYTAAALEYGNQVGALTISVTCNSGSEMAKLAQISIAPVVGAEAISGSTRMKAGTAQKMIVNMLSTATMVKLGKVYQNYMVHVQPTNEKLVVRAANMIAEITGADRETAMEMLEKAQMKVPEAIIMLEGGCTLEEAAKALAETKGNVRDAIGIVKQ